MPYTLCTVSSEESYLSANTKTRMSSSLAGNGIDYASILEQKSVDGAAYQTISKTDFTYDDKGNETRGTVYPAYGTEGEKESIQNDYTYNRLGQQTKTTVTLKSAKNPADNRTYTEEAVTYDYFGNELTYTDENGLTSKTAYDPATGEETQTVQAVGTPQESTEKEYVSQDTLKTMTLDEYGRVSIDICDGLGNTIISKDEAGGTWTESTYDYGSEEEEDSEDDTEEESEETARLLTEKTYSFQPDEKKFIVNEDGETVANFYITGKGDTVLSGTRYFYDSMGNEIGSASFSNGEMDAAHCSAWSFSKSETQVSGEGDDIQTTTTSYTKELNPADYTPEVNPDTYYDQFPDSVLTEQVTQSVTDEEGNTLTRNYKVNYTYDAEGLRSTKTVNGETTVYVWDGDQLVLELSSSGKVKNRYIRGNDLVSTDKGADTNKQYYVTNPHGDVVQLTDEEGKVIKTYEYDSFGNELNPDKKDDNPFRYCGEYYDKETEEIYLRARYYQPEVGRFLTRDSYTGESDDPESLHLYTYCYNNPVIYTDAEGDCPIPDWVKSFWDWITGANKSNNKKTQVTPKPTTIPTPKVPTPTQKKTGFEVTKKHLKKLGWKKDTRTSKRIKELNEWLNKYNMNNKNVICHFVSQCMHECSRGNIMAEQWNGDPYEYFKSYEEKPKKIWLGNTQPGDGFKFRGAGCIQITGRAIYTQFSNFVTDQKIIDQGANYIKKHKKYWWTSAVFYWKNKQGLLKCSKKKSTKVEEVTKIVNGGTNGLDERKKYYKMCKNVFEK